MQVHAANESAVFEDLVAAMADDWNVAPKATSSGRPSGIAPTMRSQAMNVPKHMSRGAAQRTDGCLVGPWPYILFYIHTLLLLTQSVNLLLSSFN